jgi:sec-independent protein translocase protein TatC
MPQENKMTFLQHLAELRKRIIIILISVFLCSSISYSFSLKILTFLKGPVEKLIFIAPTEAILVRIKLSILMGAFFASPIILYEVWKFIAPGLYVKEKRLLLPLILASWFLFILGSVFAYFVILPISVKFLLGIGAGSLEPMISAARYLTFVAYLLFGSACAFQLPLILLVLVWLGILNPKTLMSSRKYVFLLVFVVAAIITPGTDVVSQILVAIPLFLLYEISIWLSYIAYRKKKRECQQAFKEAG